MIWWTWKWVVGGRFCSLALGSRRHFLPVVCRSWEGGIWWRLTMNILSAHLGSLPSELPRPYRGITLSLLMPAWNSATRIEIVEQKHSKKSTLHTGHICRLGLVSSHWVECFTQCEYNCVNVDGSRNSTNVEVFSTWCKQGQQKRCPHMDTTASLAVSRHMLHCRDIKIDEARKDWIHIWYDPIAKGLRRSVR